MIHVICITLLKFSQPCIVPFISSISLVCALDRSDSLSSSRFVRFILRLKNQVSPCIPVVILILQLVDITPNANRCYPITALHPTSHPLQRTTSRLPHPTPLIPPHKADKPSPNPYTRVFPIPSVESRICVCAAGESGSGAIVLLVCDEEAGEESGRRKWARECQEDDRASCRRRRRSLCRAYPLCVVCTVDG